MPLLELYAFRGSGFRGSGFRGLGFRGLGFRGLGFRVGCFSPQERGERGEQGENGDPAAARRIKSERLKSSELSGRDFQETSIGRLVVESSELSTSRRVQSIG